MKNAGIFLWVWVFSISLCVKELKAGGEGYWFLKNQAHTTPENKLYDTPDWRTALDGPIRGSAAFSDGHVYIGTAKGTLYAVREKDGTVEWNRNFGSAIHSTPAVKGNRLYFTDNSQHLYCVSAGDGKEKWRYAFDKALPYDWKFDYWYSSPVFWGENIIVGGDDGYLHSVRLRDGKVQWKFKAESVIRSTPVIRDGIIYFGDCMGYVYAVDAATGKSKWRSETEGVRIDQSQYIFDRKAVISSAALSEDVCVIGSRDGFLYGFNTIDGKQLWSLDYTISWVNSTAAIREGIAVTATSDGRYVNAVEAKTGKEIWRFNTRQILWSSPLIINNHVYAQSCDGVMHILNSKTGEKISEHRTITPIQSFSSPVFTGKTLLYTNDSGILYASFGRPTPVESRTRKLALWMDKVGLQFSNNMDVRLKNYLTDIGYAVIDTNRFAEITAQSDSAPKTIVVVISAAFPDTILQGGKNSLVRRFLDRGGAIINFGFNPTVFDPRIETYNFLKAEEIFGVAYGPNDLRSFQGLYPSFATEFGKKYQLPDFWTGFAGVNKNQVDEVLGLNENGLASSWIKYYGANKKGAWIQIAMDRSNPADYNFLKYFNAK